MNSKTSAAKLTASMANYILKDEQTTAGVAMTAMVVWEEMLAMRSRADLLEISTPLKTIWEDEGTHEMRAIAFRIARWLEDYLCTSPSFEKLIDNWAFDWEVVPLFLRFVTWGPHADWTPPIENGERLVKILWARLSEEWPNNSAMVPAPALPTELEELDELEAARDALTSGVSHDEAFLRILDQLGGD